MESNNVNRSDADVSCLSLLDKFYKCCGVTHQFGSVYREEVFDNCNDSFALFKNCVMAKTVSSDAKREASTVLGVDVKPPVIDL
jgi:hypothetical protein